MAKKNQSTPRLADVEGQICELLSQRSTTWLATKWLDETNAHLKFVFSSRRRHTRCSRDWSSDVCSYDLFSPCRAAVSLSPRLRGRRDRRCIPSTARCPPRSEERRVGKECKSLWVPCQ